MKILITYFAPFGTRSFNNSKNVAQVLNRLLKTRDVISLELPVNKNAVKKIPKNFDLIIALGEFNKNKMVLECEAADETHIYYNHLCDYLHNIEKQSWESNNNYICNLINLYIINNLFGLFFHVPEKKQTNGITAKKIAKVIDQVGNINNIHTVDAYIARTITAQVTGFSKTKKATFGIFFPFNKLKKHEMTMENTSIPLDILFLSKNKRILMIHKAKPGEIVSKLSYSVLEVPFDYCYNNQIETGHTIKINSLGHWVP